MKRLTDSRLFLVVLAAVMLLALMPWQGLVHCQGAGCQGGDATADSDACGCCVAKGTPCCCVPDAPDTPDPKDPDPKDPDPSDPGCPCIQLAVPTALPTVIGVQGEEDGVAPHAAAGLAAASAVPTGLARDIRPRARTGPPLHLRLQVFLI